MPQNDQMKKSMDDFMNLNPDQMASHFEQMKNIDPGMMESMLK
jgi:hypothetical protein